MNAILEQLEHELKTVDLADAAAELLPVRTNESMFGTLPDVEKRLHALRILAMRENHRIIRDLERIAAREPIDVDAANELVIRSTTNRARIHALEGLWLASIATRAPRHMLCDVLVVREGWILVGMRKRDLRPEDTRLAMMISEELSKRPSDRTIH